jgi:hypothetical protein
VPSTKANQSASVAKPLEKVASAEPISSLTAERTESVSATANESRSKSEANQANDEGAEFSAFMDYEVRTHTQVMDFRQRDEARIYVEMIDFLIKRGASVCLMTYPVDRFYRERADKITTYPEVKEFYKKIAADRGIRYVSFWSRFDDPQMFQNTDHVNGKGSEILAAEARKACFSDR